MKQKIKTVSCPYCGKDYVIGEIFIPNYTIGQPKNIIRDSSNKIIGVDGIDSDTEETYICDRCNNKFKVKLTISCASQKLEPDSKYVSNLKKQRLILSEGSD